MDHQHKRHVTCGVRMAGKGVRRQSRPGSSRGGTCNGGASIGGGGGGDAGLIDAGFVGHWVGGVRVVHQCAQAPKRGLVLFLRRSRSTAETYTH